MRDFIVHDTRLNGATPSGPNIDSIQVNQNDPLSLFVQKTLNAAESNNGEICLKIFAHGSEKGQNIEGLPGGIIQLCKENLKLSTVDKMRPLYGKIKGGIELYVCCAARISPGCEGKDGDGNMLCYRMAQIVGTTVTASQDIQEYDYGAELDSFGQPRVGCSGSPIPSKRQPIDFGFWEGTVITYGPKGEGLKMKINPLHHNNVDRGA